MEQKQTLPIENKNLPADKQDAGEVREIAPERVDFGSPDQSPAPVMGATGGYTRSPSPVIRESARARGQMTFYEALQQVANGVRVTRVSWNDDQCYAQLHEDLLYLKEQRTGKFSIWGISEGDMSGTDYIVC